MQRYVALLRGINLGNHNRISMDQLKQACEQLGLQNVTTYLQSGNLIFTYAIKSKDILPSLMTEMIKNTFNLDIPVIVRSAAEFSSSVAANPFLSRPDIDPTKLHLTLLAEQPAPHHTELLDHIKTPDQFVLAGNNIYLYCPNGYGRTKLTNTFFEQKLHTCATTRNWATITTLSSIAQQPTATLQ